MSSIRILENRYFYNGTEVNVTKRVLVTVYRLPHCFVFLATMGNHVTGEKRGDFMSLQFPICSNIREMHGLHLVS